MYVGDTHKYSCCLRGPLDAHTYGTFNIVMGAANAGEYSCHCHACETWGLTVSISRVHRFWSGACKQAHFSRSHSVRRIRSMGTVLTGGTLCAISILVCSLLPLSR